MSLKININPKVRAKFQKYPPAILPKLQYLRQLIVDTAKGIEEIDAIEETLKWGEPSYLVKKGSTIRIDWKAKSPNQYAIYFKCTSKLVPTFKALYAKDFTFEKNRAIVFDLEDNIPTTKLKHCICLALTYHRIKHLPNLGTTT